MPIAGFSDGTHVVAVLGRGEYVRCVQRSARKAPACGRKEGFSCTQAVGECMPSPVQIPVLCNLATGTGCLPGTTCQPSPTGFCVDPTSSQNDGTAASLRVTIAHDQEIAIQDPASPASFTSVARLATNKFINATTRTVACFTGSRCGSDYGPGHGALLMWGRPGFQGLDEREAQLYLLAHRLPIRPDKRGRVRLRPRYFAGVGANGEPRWSRRQQDAAPLALDGVVGGSPHEEQPIVSQMSVSWIGEPVNKWVMLYGGDLADYLLPDPVGQRPGPRPARADPLRRPPLGTVHPARAAPATRSSRRGRRSLGARRRALPRPLRGRGPTSAHRAIPPDRRTFSCPGARRSERRSTSGASTGRT